MLLFLLVLVGGIGALSPREAAAQLPSEDARGINLPVKLQSQADPAWAQWPVHTRHENNPDDTISKCGCALAAFSTIINWMLVGGARPHYSVPLDATNNIGWYSGYHFTPAYLDAYLTYGETEYEGDEGLIKGWGYHKKASRGCGTYNGMTGMFEHIGDQNTIEGIKVGPSGISTSVRGGLDTAAIDKNLLQGIPSIVRINSDFDAPKASSNHIQIIVGKDLLGNYLVLDPNQASLSAPFVPGMSRDVWKNQFYGENMTTNGRTIRSGSSVWSRQR